MSSVAATDLSIAATQSGIELISEMGSNWAGSGQTAYGLAIEVSCHCPTNSYCGSFRPALSRSAISV